MANLPTSSVIFPACTHIKRQKPDLNIDHETLKSFSLGSRVLPLYEKRIYDHSRIKHYSLQTNESLRCCWKEYLRQLDSRKRTPFQFPRPEDDHFYKHNARYEPSQSLANRAALKQLCFSQTGDIRGYTPVPIEEHQRRTAKNVRKPRPVSAKQKWNFKKLDVAHS